MEKFSTTALNYRTDQAHSWRRCPGETKPVCTVTLKGQDLFSDVKLQVNNFVEEKNSSKIFHLGGQYPSAGTYLERTILSRVAQKMEYYFCIPKYQHHYSSQCTLTRWTDLI